MKTCIWDEEYDSLHETECGNTFEFISDGIVENNFKFCPFCGGQILVTVEFGDLDEDLE